MDKDRRIQALEDRVAVLENELRSCREISIPNDVVDRKRAEEALRAGEEIYRRLIESTGDWVWEVDQDFVLTYDSPMSRKILGYEPGEVMGKSPFSFMPEDELERIKSIAWPAIARHETIQRMENRLMKKDGSIATIVTTAIPLFDESRHYRGYRGINHDITERKRAEEALRESEEMFRALAEAAPIMVLFHRGGKYLYANAAAESITGYSRDELLDMDFWRLLAPEYQDTIKASGLARVRGENPSTSNQVKILTKQGEEKWTEYRSARMIYQGQPAIIILVADVTERRRAEETLKKREADLAQAQAIAHLGSWEHDIVEGILVHSAEIYRIFGIPPEKLGNTLESLIAVIYDEDREHVRRSIEAMLSGVGPNNFDFRLVRSDGQVRIIHAEWEVNRDASGKPIYIHGTAQDITDLKRAENELKEAKAQSELYLDLISHDINNLHQIALGYLELALGMPPGVQYDEMIEKPIEVLQRSAQLIQNVRKLQKLHDGVFQTELVDVCRVLVNVQREYGAVPGKTVALNLNGLEHCQVRANDLLYDVFSNLVGNAIKHTGDRAEILIDVDIVNDDARYCRVMIEDDGPGVPDDFKGRIFNRLLRGTNKAKGMGLGLYLVKSLVDSYGGRVWVEDRIQGDYTKGARFAVMLPAVGI